MVPANKAGAAKGRKAARPESPSEPVPRNGTGGNRNRRTGGREAAVKLKSERAPAARLPGLTALDGAGRTGRLPCAETGEADVSATEQPLRAGVVMLSTGVGGPMNRFAAFVVAFALLMAPAVAGESAVAALEKSLPDKVQAALKRIDAGGRRLLALRGYLHAARWLESRWSWTEAEIAAYEKSEAHTAALEAVAAVTRAFEAKNEGYSLYVNTNVRSLDDQIASWNRNASVGAAAGELATAYGEWTDRHADAGEGETRAFLSGWEPEAKVAIAVPGVSPHGRARAFDFQIAQNGGIVVAASTKIIEAVWDGEGWTEKLKQAVTESGMPFKGPLESPREPWHYDYAGGAEFDPSAAAKQSVEDAKEERGADDPALPARAPRPTPRKA
jgi:hypothetical protein